jgi:DNA polymerase-3 subunit epsilon
MSDQELIDVLEKSGDYRVLRRVDLSGLPTEEQTKFDFDLSCVVVLDLETTGLDPERHAIVELAMRTVWIDVDFNVVALGTSLSWLEDPGEPLSPEIQRLTGLTDADLLGRAIDAAAVSREVLRASLVVSHHARFDRKFFEARFPLLKDLPWGCSCHEVDWPARGFDGRALGSLLTQVGRFSLDAHRAGADVDALITLLMHRFADTGNTVLAELDETSGRETHLIHAFGASFDMKNALKDRGYRWDPQQCVWWCEVEEKDFEDEKRWLLANVYAPRHLPTAKGPRVHRITRRERHR